MLGIGAVFISIPIIKDVVVSKEYRAKYTFSFALLHILVIGFAIWFLVHICQSSICSLKALRIVGILASVCFGLLGALGVVGVILKVITANDDRMYYNAPREFINETRTQLLVSLGLLALSGVLYSII